jgi:hypothetical protein
MKALIKQDINFLEYPLWIQDKELADKTEGYVWKDLQGYIYRSGYKPPIKTDFVFLLSLLLQSQQEGWKEEIITTKYKILKKCGISRNKDWYDRLEDSLKRWENVRLHFKGTFYDGIKYRTLHFGILDAWGIEENTGKIKIRLSKEYLLKIKESNFFKYINFEHIKALKSPLAVRLYEILIKSFQGRNSWEIDVIKLARKIPMNEKYPADIIPKIKAGVNRINEHTTLKIDLTIRQHERGKAILVFKKIPENDIKQAKEVIPTIGLPEDESFHQLLKLLPKEHRTKKTILEAIAKLYKKQGYNYIARNIRYTNEKCKDNYRAYLSNALKEDWGIAFEEDQEVEKILKEEKAQKAKEEAERKRQEEEMLKRENELFNQAGEYIKTLPPDQVEALKEEAFKTLDPNLQKLVKAGNNTGKFALELHMKLVVKEQLKKPE